MACLPANDVFKSPFAPDWFSSKDAFRDGFSAENILSYISFYYASLSSVSLTYIYNSSILYFNIASSFIADYLHL